MFTKAILSLCLILAISVQVVAGQCPVARCAAPKDGCYYVTSYLKNENGCPKYPCGELKCETNDNHEEQENNVPCPMPSCMAPGVGCKYTKSDEKGPDGCPKYPCGKYTCIAGEGTWTAWGKCSKSCDGGVKKRACVAKKSGGLRRNLQILTSGCFGEKITECNTHLCKDDEELYFVEFQNEACSGGELVSKNVQKNLASCANWANDEPNCGLFFTFGNGKCSCQKKEGIEGASNYECDKRIKQQNSAVYFIEKESLYAEGDDQFVVEVAEANMQCKGEKSEWMDAEDHLNCAYLVKHAESCAPFFTFGNGKCACQIKDTMNEECEEMETKNGFNVYFLEEQGLVLENEEEEEIDGGDNGDAPWCEKVKCQKNLCSDGKPRRQVGGNCCSCPVSPAKIPKNCVTWYDGCNTCNVKDGKPTGCTKKACLLNTNPYCKQYVGQVNGDGPVIMDGAVQRGRQ